MNAVPVLESTHQSLSEACHLRAVVAPQKLRGAALGDQPLQRRDDGVRIDAARDQHHQRLARELVNVEQLQRPPVPAV